MSDVAKMVLLMIRESEVLRLGYKGIDNLSKSKRDNDPEVGGKMESDIQMANQKTRPNL